MTAKAQAEPTHSARHSTGQFICLISFNCRASTCTWSECGVPEEVGISSRHGTEFHLGYSLSYAYIGFCSSYVSELPCPLDFILDLSMSVLGFTILGQFTWF